VIRACLRAAQCPVVVIGLESMAGHSGQELQAAPDAADHVPASWQRALEGSAAR
jgi:hypothetical protein